MLRLLAEVERLHQELAIRESSEQEKVIDYLGKECVDWEDKYLTLAGENAKLRKLALDMRQTIDGMQEQSNSGSGYVLCADVCPRWEVECSKQPPDVCWYELRMRELGVEAS